KKILHVKICQPDLLMAVAEGVQPAVGVFLEEEKVRRVVLNAIGVQVSKQTQTGLFGGEQQPTEVAIERLNAGPNGNEIIIGAQAGDFVLEEGVLQSSMRVRTSGALANVDVHDAAFPCPKLIEVEGRRDPDLPVHGLEAGVAVQQVKRQANGFLEQSLAALAEELAAARVLRGDATRHEQPATIERRGAAAGEAEEGALAEDWLVAFDAVTVERV